MDRPTITLEWNSAQLEQLRDRRIERALRNALSKAGGDALRFLRTGSSKVIRGRKKIRAARVRKGLPLVFPKARTEISSLEWRMNVSGEPIPLAEFPYRVVRKKEGRRHGGGVRVQVNVGKWTMVRSVFVARMKSGHVGIFRRRGADRLPIDEAFTSRLSDVVQDHGFVPFVWSGAQARFAASFDRLFPLELAKVMR
jgi:hypothetical protein